MKALSIVLAKNLLIPSIIITLIFLVVFDYQQVAVDRELGFRNEMLIKLLKQTGYGGAIDNFKNYILRQDPIYFQAASVKLSNTLNLISDYRKEQSGHLQASEAKQLETIYATFEHYKIHLHKARELTEQQGLSSLEIDAQVRIDDSPTIAAIEGMIAQLESSKSKDSKISFTAKVLVHSIIALLMMAIFLNLKKLAKNELSLQKNLTKLEHANHELIEFSYRTSHDLKSPITSIKGLCKLSKHDLVLQDYKEVEANLDKMITQANGLERLIENILKLNKADQDETPVQPIDFKDFMEKIEENFAAILADRHIELITEIHLSAPVYGKVSQYNLVLTNLIENSIKYYNSMQTKPIVRVKIHQPEAMLEIEVSDNGIGIPEIGQGDVFGMFKIFHPQREKSFGLGLYMVKKTVSIMGGDIQCFSSPEGTRFILRIPGIV